MAPVFYLEIFKGCEWLLYKADPGWHKYRLKGQKLHGLGIWTKVFEYWKETLKDHWHDPIFLQVYPDAFGAYDPEEHQPSAAFETTIGGAFEYLLQNREPFGFKGEMP